MKTSPSSLKIRHIVTQLKSGLLVPRPEFQRRLVWTGEDRARFIDTILKGYPFPEIYLANGDVNVDTGEGCQLLVDGQQRVTAMADYFHGEVPVSGIGVTPYADLAKEDKELFLNYDVAVRDLGSISPTEIIEVFKRINSTKYSLNEIEINNAVYAGALMKFAAGLTEHEFFDSHKVFRAVDVKRMGDVRFVLQVLITMIAGYFNRDELFESFLRDNNDHFQEQFDIAKRLFQVLAHIDECGFLVRSRIWKKSDLFSTIIELDVLMRENKAPTPSETLDRLDKFFEAVDNEGLESVHAPVALYAKAAIQASNDRLNRVRRGQILNAILTGIDSNQIQISM